MESATRRFFSKLEKSNDQFDAYYELRSDSIYDLRVMRVKSGITVQEIADELGVRSGAIYKTERMSKSLRHNNNSGIYNYLNAIKRIKARKHKEKENIIYTLDERKIREHYEKNGVTLPNGDRFWRAVHEAIVRIGGPPEVVEKSLKWLVENGYREKRK